MPERVAVLFDLDGVLVDSYEAWFRLVNRARVAFGFETVDRARFDRGWGQGVTQDVDDYFAGRTLEEVDGYFNSRFMDEIEHVVVDAATHATLDRLRAAGHPVAVVTNTRRPLAEQMLAALEIRPRIDDLAAAGDAPRDKPAPDLVLLACERLGRGTDGAVMVGDSAYDRDAARAAGVLFVGFRTEGDRRVERLDEIPDLLRLHRGFGG